MKNTKLGFDPNNLKTSNFRNLNEGGMVGDEPTAQEKAKKAWKKQGRGKVKKWFKRTFGGTGDKELCQKGGKC